MMTDHQMRPELVSMMKSVVERLNVSSETYYHAVMLFNVIQLKKNSDTRPEYFKIPIKKQNLNWSSGSDSDEDQKSVDEQKTEYVQVHHSQMPQTDKLNMVVCLFLVHKLYEPYPLCLSHILRHFEIHKQYEEYIISLEKEFLVKLTYKIQNLLPSNQTLFACQLWDEFIQNIDQSCLDVKFEINSLLSSSNNQKNTIQTAHQIKQKKKQPEFKNLRNQKAFQKICLNIDFLVHSSKIYDLYLRKAEKEDSENLPVMKKIGIAIMYVTILQVSQMAFTKKYKFNQQIINLSTQSDSSKFLDFVFNDFLEQNFKINLTHLKEQIMTVNEILRKNNKKIQNKQTSQQKQINSTKNIVSSKKNDLLNFLLKGKQKIKSQKYHLKCKKNFKKYQNASISSTKTDQQNMESFILCKQRSHSIVSKNNLRSKDKILESTIYESNMSQKGESLIGQDFQQVLSKKKYKNMSKQCSRHSGHIDKGSQQDNKSYSGKNHLKINRHSHSIKVPKQHQQTKYRVSQFYQEL